MSRLGFRSEFRRQRPYPMAVIAMLLAMIAIIVIFLTAALKLPARTAHVAAVPSHPHITAATERGMSLYRQAEMTPLRERQSRPSLWDADNDDSFGQRRVEPADSRGERR